MQLALTPPMAGLYRPNRFAGRLAYDTALVLGGSLLIVLCSRLSFTLAFNPAVPITAQTFAVLVVGALLGARRGALAVGVFIGEGLAGVPVGATGISGAAWILGPTGGYVVGFVAAAYVTGVLAERGWDRKMWSTVAAMSIGTALIFLHGLLWLAFQAKMVVALGMGNITPISPDSVLMAGLWPYLPGAVIKIVLAALVLPSGWAMLGWLRGERLNPGLRERRANASE